MSRLQIGFETIREILEHRLHQEDIERLLHGLDEAGKAELFFRITELLRRTTALADIANRVNDTLSLDVLFPRLMEVVTEALNADRSSLFLHDPDTHELFSRVVQGDAIGEIRFPSHLGVAGSVFTSGTAEIIADAYADPRFNQEVDRRTGYRTRNILCVPIRNKNREVIGITQALNKNVGDFDLEDQRMLEALSLQASAARECAAVRAGRAPAARRSPAAGSQRLHRFRDPPQSAADEDHGGGDRAARRRPGHAVPLR